MTAKRFYMDKSGDLYDKENGLLMLDFGYSYDGVNCKRIIDLLNELNDENKQLKNMIFVNEKAKRFINNPNERPIRTNEDYWVGVNNITSFLMERLNDRE